MVALGGALVALSPFLAWVHVVFIGNLTLFQLLRAAGHSASLGWWAVVVGVSIGVVALVFHDAPSVVATWAIGVAVVAAAVAGPNTYDMVRFVNASDGLLGVGPGVIAAAVGETLLVAGGIAALGFHPLPTHATVPGPQVPPGWQGPQVPPGWYPSPVQPGYVRWWSGTQWVGQDWPVPQGPTPGGTTEQ
jgi:hypothetical protein